MKLFKIYFLGIFLTFTFCFGDVSVKEIEGGKKVVMENSLFKLTIDPARGGRVSSFIWKDKGENWVLPGNSGFFMDHLWQQKWPGELLDKKYNVKIIEKGPTKGTVEVDVIIEGKGDSSISGIHLIRRMSIYKKSKRIDVKIKLENPTNQPKSPGLWIQNVINVGGSRENLWTYRPSTRGVICAGYDFKKAKRILPEIQKNDFVYDPIAGWIAETHPPSGKGIVFYMDYNYLRCLYCCGGSLSVEWWYDQIRLSPGKSLETEIILWPIYGLDSVTYASYGAVCDLKMKVEGKNLSLINRIVKGPFPLKSPIKVKLQLIDYDTGKEICKKEFTNITISDKPAEQKFLIKNAPLEKNLLARAVISDSEGKSEFYENYRPGPAIMGTEKLYQTTRPSKIKKIEKPPVIKKTPHKGIKILHIRGLFFNYYKIDETGKVLNAEIKNSNYGIFVYGPSISYFPGDYKELMEYDVIIINNVPIDGLDYQAQEFLADYVKNGGVLIVIGGHWAFGGGNYKGTKFEKILPVRTTDKFDIYPVENGFLREKDGKLFSDSVGTLWIQKVDFCPGSDVLIYAGKMPFLIKWKKGKGIAAVILGLCYGEKKKDMTFFWEWENWPEYMAEKIKEMIKQTE